MNKSNLMFLGLWTIACWQNPVVAQTATAPPLLPFQARLTDQNGVAVSNGVRVVQFKIFGVPSGGPPLWAGELHRTTVNGGLVNVLLGSKTPFTGVDFDRHLYLEITVDINGDNAITLADPPMLPRQVVLPVVFAKEAADSRLLDGFDWGAFFDVDPATGKTNPATGKIKVDRLPNPRGLDAPGGVLPNAVLANADKTVVINQLATLKVLGPMSNAGIVTLKAPLSASDASNKQIDFTGGYFLFRDNQAVGQSRLWFDSPNNGGMVFGPRNVSDLLANLRLKSRYAYFQTGPLDSDLVNIIPGGKLGLGVVPTVKLDVVGDARVSGSMTVGGNALVSGSMNVGGNALVSGSMTLRSPDAPGVDSGNNLQIDLTGGYGIYRDHRDVSTSDPSFTRLWIDTPNDAGIAIGPRTGSSYAKLTRIKSQQVNFESARGTVVIKDGSINVDGVVKTFVIEHPDDSSKYLVHATLEGPESAVFYRGTAQLQDGSATVKLPAYFESLTATEGRTVQLTAIDGFDRLAIRSKDGQVVRAAEFEVISDNPRSEQVFMWEVKAVRKDVPALSVEVPKSGAVVNAFGPYTFITPVR